MGNLNFLMTNKFPGQKMAVELMYCPTGAKYGIVDIGESGYRPLVGRNDYSLRELDLVLLNSGFLTRLPTEEEREAAYIGSAFGWDVPGADPDMIKSLNEEDNQTT